MVECSSKLTSYSNQKRQFCEKRVNHNISLPDIITILAVQAGLTVRWPRRGRDAHDFFYEHACNVRLLHSCFLMQIRRLEHSPFYFDSMNLCTQNIPFLQPPLFSLPSHFYGSAQMWTFMAQRKCGHLRLYFPASSFLRQYADSATAHSPDSACLFSFPAAPSSYQQIWRGMKGWFGCLSLQRDVTVTRVTAKSRPPSKRAPQTQTTSPSLCCQCRTESAL